MFTVVVIKADFARGLKLFKVDFVLLFAILLDLAELRTAHLVEAVHEVFKIVLEVVQYLLVALVELECLIEVVGPARCLCLLVWAILLGSKQELQVENWIHIVLQVHIVRPV